MQPEEAAALRSRVEMLRHDAMVRMLTERSILTEIQADRSDRVLDLTELKNENIPKKNERVGMNKFNEKNSVFF